MQFNVSKIFLLTITIASVYCYAGEDYKVYQESSRQEKEKKKIARHLAKVRIAQEKNDDVEKIYKECRKIIPQDFFDRHPYISTTCKIGVGIVIGIFLGRWINEHNIRIDKKY